MHFFLKRCLKQKNTLIITLILVMTIMIGCMIGYGSWLISDHFKKYLIVIIISCCISILLLIGAYGLFGMMLCLIVTLLIVSNLVICQFNNQTTWSHYGLIFSCAITMINLHMMFFQQIKNSLINHQLPQAFKKNHQQTWLAIGDATMITLMISAAWFRLINNVDFITMIVIFITSLIAHALIRLLMTLFIKTKILTKQTWMLGFYFTTSWNICNGTTIVKIILLILLSYGLFLEPWWWPIQPNDDLTNNIISNIIPLTTSFLLIILYLILRFKWTYILPIMIMFICNMTIMISWICLFKSHVANQYMIVMLTLMNMAINNVMMMFGQIRAIKKQHHSLSMSDIILQVSTLKHHFNIINLLALIFGTNTLNTTKLLIGNERWHIACQRKIVKAYQIKIKHPTETIVKGINE